MFGNERWSDHEEMLRSAMDGKQSGLWTAMPGYVVSYDPTGNGSGSPTVTVQLGIQGTTLDSTGAYKQVNYPVLPDVPVMFMNGGGVTLTLPIAVNDECLVVFGSRCIDYGWNAGGIQPAIDARKHDINDGFAIVGPRSGKRPLGNISTTRAQLRSDDGTTYVELDPTGHVVNVVAPGGMTFTTPKLTVNGQIVATGDMTAGSVTMQTHVHGGVQSGSSNTSVGSG